VFARFGLEHLDEFERVASHRFSKEAGVLPHLLALSHVAAHHGHFGSTSMKAIQKNSGLFS